MRLNRALLVGIAIVVAALAIASALNLIVGARLDQIDARVITLSAKLEPVTPEDVLCGFSDQMQYLARELATHCQTVHSVTIPPMAVPLKCRHPSEAPPTLP